MVHSFTQSLTDNAQSTYLFIHLSTYALRVHPFAHAGLHCIHPLNGNVQIEAFSHFLSGLLAPSLLSTHSLSSLISLLTLIDLLT
jgi:hypothetical protein